MHPMSFSRARTATRAAALAAALVLATTALAVTGAPVPAGASTGPCTSTTAPQLLAGSTDVFEIDSAAKLIYLSLNFASLAPTVGSITGDWREQDFVQTADIDLDGCLFTPIGTQTFDDDDGFGGEPFTGSYDGQDKTIEGLKIHVVHQAGLFGGAFDAAFTRVRLIEVDVIAEAGAPGRVVFFDGDDPDREGLQAGALVADLAGGSVADSSATGTVTGAFSVGGLIGVSDADITNSSATVTVNGGVGGIGGFVGDLLSGGSITNSSASGAVLGGSGADEVGGLVGASFEADVTDSHATGDVEGRDKIGGLVGYLENGTISNSFATGTVTGGFEFIGGLVGLVGAIDGSSEYAEIDNSYSTGNVAGFSAVGALVGQLMGSTDGSTIHNSYSTGSLNLPGGLVGGTAAPGGTSATTTASFFPADFGLSAAGTPLTAAEFTSFATFADAGWPIVAGWAPFDVGEDQVWGICSAVNEGRPFLLWQFSADPCTVTPPPSTPTPSEPSPVPPSTPTPSAPSPVLPSTPTPSAPSPVPPSTPTPSAPSPVLLGGVAPTQPAGQGVWQQTDGTSTPLDVTAPAGNQLRYEADGVRVTLTGTAATDPSRGLVAAADGEIVCEVCVAAAAGQVIEVWMFSTPRLVAAHRIGDDECQVFAIPMSAPLDGEGPVTAGAHTLQLAIPTADGMQAVNVGVTVGGPVPASVPAGEGSVTTPLDRTGGLLLVVLLIAAAAAAASVRSARRTSTTTTQ